MMDLTPAYYIPITFWIIGIVAMVFITKNHRERKTWIIFSIFIGVIAVFIFLLNEARLKNQLNKQNYGSK